MEQYDLFGEPVVQRTTLRDRYGAPPFTVLDAKDGTWMARKRKWIDMGIRSEIGRDAKSFHTKDYEGWGKMNFTSDTSIFDPVLCELMYRWFCKEGGSVLDPFAGGSVRGIVAAVTGRRYRGIELRGEQVESNRRQAEEIIGGDADNIPVWHTGDAARVLDDVTDTFDMLFTCPPYADKEVYSDLPEDISNMAYGDFIFRLEDIMRKACSKVRPGGYAVVVMGEVRDRDGNYYGLVPDTVKLMQRCAGMKYYNECILVTPYGTAAFRAEGNMQRGCGKLVKVHQNVLIFKKIATEL